MSKTINMEPSWETAAHIYIMVLQISEDLEAKRAARKDLMRLARSFDRTQTDEYRGALDGLLDLARDFIDMIEPQDDEDSQADVVKIQKMIEVLS